MEETVRTIGELGDFSVFIRLALATLMGGLIGLERGRKRRPAGFRTHMLVCIGAALVMLTNEFIAVRYALADPARLGAQVISGIGFLGAGTIIVTRHNQVIGLTTAAGLWASACMGLAIGVGFYSGALMAFGFIILAVLLLHKIDNYVVARSRVVELYVEFVHTAHFSGMLRHMREQNMRVSDLEIIKARDPQGGMAAMMTIKLPGKMEHADTVQMLRQLEGISFIEEI